MMIEDRQKKEYATILIENRLKIIYKISDHRGILIPKKKHGSGSGLSVEVGSGSGQHQTVSTTLADTCSNHHKFSLFYGLVLISRRRTKPSTLGHGEPWRRMVICSR